MAKDYGEIRISNGRKLAEHKYDGQIHIMQILTKNVLTTILLFPDGSIEITETQQHPKN